MLFSPLEGPSPRLWFCRRLEGEASLHFLRFRQHLRPGQVFPVLYQQHWCSIHPRRLNHHRALDLRHLRLPLLQRERLRHFLRLPHQHFLQILSPVFHRLSLPHFLKLQVPQQRPVLAQMQRVQRVELEMGTTEINSTVDSWPESRSVFLLLLVLLLERLFLHDIIAAGIIQVLRPDFSLGEIPGDISPRNLATHHQETGLLPTSGRHSTNRCPLRLPHIIDQATSPMASAWQFRLHIVE